MWVIYVTLAELRLKEDKIRLVVDAWNDLDQTIAYAYLHRAYEMRISDCDKTLARALLGGDRDGGGRGP